MTATTDPPAPVGLLVASARRVRIELLRFRRTREQVIFTFALPVVRYILLATVLDDEIGQTGIEFNQYLLAGLVASVALYVGVSDLAPMLALEKSDGTTKRLAGTPMPPAAYVIGKLGYVLVLAPVQAAVLIVLGVAAFGTDLPDAEGWFTLGWVLVLGLTSAFLLGIAISTLISNPKSASSVVNFPFIILQFISGIWFIFGELPGWLQGVASLFPLRWMALGLRSAFLPDSFAMVEPGGTWQLGNVALVLGIWTLGGLAVVMTRFRLRTER